MQVFMKITLVKNKIKRAIKALDKIVISIQSIIMIFVRLYEKKLSKRRNLMFISTKSFDKFEIDNKVLSHIIDVNLCAIQVNNISFEIVIIFKNSRFNFVYKYKEENCYVVSLEYNYLVVEFSR